MSNLSFMRYKVYFVKRFYKISMNFAEFIFNLKRFYLITIKLLNNSHTLILLEFNLF